MLVISTIEVNALLLRYLNKATNIINTIHAFTFVTMCKTRFTISVECSFDRSHDIMYFSQSVGIHTHY